MLPERPFSYRAGDDEDHRLALCGLTPDERSGEELEDFYSRHYDFNIFGGPQVCSSGLIAANWPRVIPSGPCMQAAQGDDPAKRASSEQHLRVSPPSAKQGPEDVGGAPPRIFWRCMSSGPAPLF